MLDRDAMVARIKDVIDARMAGRGADAMALIAPDATYEIAADVANLPGFPPGGLAKDAVGDLIGLITYHSVTYDKPIVEGNRVAMVMHVDAEANGIRHPLRLCGLWEFDAAGRPTSLVEYADTAAMRDWLTRGSTAPTIEPVQPAA